VSVDESGASRMFRAKFQQYKALSDQHGTDGAWEAMLTDYPERQKQHMGPFLEAPTLAEGFRRAVPLFARMGMQMEVIDASNGEVDAALEIQRTCPVLALSKEYGIERPCRVICEMDVEATRRAFPHLRGEILATQADGACVCVFKYERARRV
jgi:predicted ArsR family transcriptional regulator